MKHSESIQRIFNKPDAEILQQSEVMLSSFNDDKQAFVSLFPDLADPFAVQWSTANAHARSLLPDYASRSNIIAETFNLETLLDQGRELYQSLLLYARLAFPGNAVILTQLGQPDYEAARKSQLKLPVLMKVAYAKASEPAIKQALTAKGMKAADIDLLQTLAEDIAKQDVKQENTKNSRSADASERIAAMNAVYEKMSLVSECSKLVFRNDALRYSFYLLTDGPATGGEKPATPEENK
jgi:hypothetical protein